MQALLKKQTELLEKLDEKSKQDRLIQLAQLYESRRIDGDGDRVEEQLKELNKNVKSLNDKTGDGLNSNVVKLFKEMKKVSEGITSRALNNEESAKITGQVGERRQFNTIKPRVDSFKAGVKDFFTMRGFLDKTGIAERGSGGLISEYLDRGEERKKFADSRLKVDQSSTNMEAGKIAKAEGKDFKTMSDDEKDIYKKQASKNLRQTYNKQFDEQQKVQYEIKKNEEALDVYKKQGFTDQQIERTPEFKRRGELAADIAKVDTRLRPEGFDARTGMVKEKPQTAQEQEVSAKAPSADILQFPGGSSNALEAASNEEAMLEQNRMVAEQTGLLTKIEENTRALKGGLSGGGGNQRPTAAAANDSSFGVSDMLGGAKRLGGIARTAGRGLMTGVKTAGSFLMKRAAPLAAIGAVGAGVYEGVSGFRKAGESEQAELKNIDAKVASGEITEEQAKGLRVEAKEKATVGKSESVGKGGGMAVGGAAGALKGAAVGAAIGSAVPIVGTVVGGAVGATVGALGGTYLGGKIGGAIGSGFGKAKNWLFGGKKDEAQGKEIGPNYKASLESYKDSTPADHLEKQYPGVSDRFRKLAEKNPPKSDSLMSIEIHEQALVTKALSDQPQQRPVAPGDKTAEALKKTAEGVTPTATPAVAKTVEGSTSPQIAAIQPKTESDPFTVDGKTMPKKLRDTIGKMDEADGARSIAAWKVLVSDKADNQTKMGAGQLLEQMTTKYSDNNTAKLKPADSPSTGNVISKQSGDNEQAKLDAGKGGGNTAVVAAPTINNNNTVQNSPVKLPPRNTDSTVNKYMQSRWAF
jgi:hypothetical protein